MRREKQLRMNEFGDLLNNVLWSKEPTPFIKQLENLIISKKQFDFTKYEFIKYYLLSSKSIEKYDQIDRFILDFFNDSYDAVTFRTTDYSTVLLLRQRILDFNNIIQEI